MESKVRYRLYTEDKNPAAVIKLIAARFESANVASNLTGLWKGQEELSIVIEIITDDSPETLANVKALAGEIKAANHQEAVLVTAEKVFIELV